ncbi:hypothetical protein WN944_025820 [Citrus x changshan-huyou]|uniref:Epidermal patterning factor-like protein n=1 Tax=Citrus x changshan-huyou TaxID=2935761 RepID=A0AAP0QDB4_9ROSI
MSRLPIPKPLLRSQSFRLKCHQTPPTAVRPAATVKKTVIFHFISFITFIVKGRFNNGLGLAGVGVRVRTLTQMFDPYVTALAFSPHARNHTCAVVAILLTCAISTSGDVASPPAALFLHCLHIPLLRPNPTRYVSLDDNRTGGAQEKETRVLDQKRISGPGSSPPTCRSKCGRCSPCKPVHVPIQPGLSMPLEYYPEAWRCKCGNKLFMP